MLDPDLMDHDSEMQHMMKDLDSYEGDSGSNHPGEPGRIQYRIRFDHHHASIISVFARETNAPRDLACTLEHIPVS